MMIDIHSHILPGLDDGPSTLTMALAMARMAVDRGVSTMVATPHTLNGVYHNSRSAILEACVVFNKALEQENIALGVLPGCEAHLCPELMGEIESGEITTLNDQGRYVLLELPHPFVPQGVIAFINRLNAMNLTPIIAHGERSHGIQQNPSIMQDFIHAGALCQITAQSLDGSLGRNPKRCCKTLLEAGLVHLVASDAHDIRGRKPGLKHVSKIIVALVGREEAHRLLVINPIMVIASN
ncbi:MAG: hypothetical protein JEZ02_03645 [Desulfatibacillum sp.]|nr:hypothetical protein [Desulfatibacillum sp.]